jgi:hypothetical protein
MRDKLRTPAAKEQYVWHEEDFQRKMAAVVGIGTSDS